MVGHTRSEAADELKAAGIDRVAFTPKQFRSRNGDMSPSYYAKLCAKGLGPKTTHILGKNFIFIEDETEWREARRAESEAAA